MPIGLSNGEVILVVVFAAIPVAAIVFVAGAANALREVGKGRFAIDEELPQAAGTSPAPVSAAVREAEIRQLLEAKSYRRQARGGEALDVEAELRRMLAAEQAAVPTELGADRQLVAEVRSLVVARNERRARQGKEPLDVEREVARQLRELENLGQ